jgi:hypothetical protein
VSREIATVDQMWEGARSNLITISHFYVVPTKNTWFDGPITTPKI